ncbi:putative protein phosphatase 2C 27, partial [Drosera capensis]
PEPEKRFLGDNPRAGPEYPGQPGRYSYGTVHVWLWSTFTPSKFTVDFTLRFMPVWSSFTSLAINPERYWMVMEEKQRHILSGTICQRLLLGHFVATDAAFAKSCSHESSFASGTTALTAMIFCSCPTISSTIAFQPLRMNAGDCEAVLSRSGMAIEMSKDHHPCCMNERTRIESLGGYVVDGYLNGQLSVTRALGDWHLKGPKELGKINGTPELKLLKLTKGRRVPVDFARRHPKSTRRRKVVLQRDGRGSNQAGSSRQLNRCHGVFSPGSSASCGDSEATLWQEHLGRRASESHVMVGRMGLDLSSC